MGKIFTFLILAAMIFLPSVSTARDPGNITDWYIKDFQSTVTVQTDSSLLVEEKITADAGNLPDKHGIFYVLPTETKTDKGIIKTPVSLVSITDFNGSPVKYSQSTSNFDHTVTWKIGDPDVSVTGVNYYKIVYSVKNAVRSQTADFDELYWNLSGYFWDIEIDKFSANVIFPKGANKDNSKIYLYSGNLGAKDNKFSGYEWIGENNLQVSSNQTLAARQGITASITFPKGFVKPYQPGFFETYGDYLWFLIAIAVFICAYSVWNKYGKDPRVDKTVIPEFEIPENLTPMEVGLLAASGDFSDKLISASIVNLAVKKLIVIEEIKKIWAFGKNDFKLKKIAPDSEFIKLTSPEKTLADKIFDGKNEIMLSELKNEFYKNIPAIKNAGMDALKAKNLIYQSGLTMRAAFVAAGFVVLFGMFAAVAMGRWPLILALAISAATLFVFGALMPKRTPAGAELNWRIKGFRLYMETAEKYRARFYEKENIFEKFLPYAIVLGMAKLWIKKMEEIYGKEYFAAYHPVWYVGSIASFDADSFTTHMNSISSSIASNVGTASGAAGAGAAGGGGGGGGGGGW